MGLALTNLNIKFTNLLKAGVLMREDDDFSLLAGFSDLTFGAKMQESALF